MTGHSKKIAQGSLRKTLTDAGHRVDPKEFICQGSFLFKSMGHPNKDEIADALKFAQNQIQGGESNK